MGGQHRGGFFWLVLVDGPEQANKDGKEKMLEKKKTQVKVWRQF